MKEKPSERLEPENISQLVSEIQIFCLRLHDYFDEKVWEHKYSFHNSDHVRKVWLMAENYFAFINRQMKINVGNLDDPLNLIGSLNSWNKLHNTNFSLEDLAALVKIAIAFHDVGNIASSLNIEEGGSYDVRFLERYTSLGAEARSANIASEYLASCGFTREQITLVVYLINETTFQPNNIQDNFALFMRVVDQLGGNVLGSENVLDSEEDFQNGNRRNENDVNSGVLEIKTRVLGLLIEMIEEGRGCMTVNPYRFLNFLRIRGAELLGDLNAVDVLIQKLSLVVAPEIDVKSWGDLTVNEFRGILEKELNSS